MAGASPNLDKDIILKTDEAEQDPNRVNPNKTMPRHMDYKITRKKNLKGSQRKMICHL